MSKSRTIAYGSVGAIVVAGAILAVPASRHAIRHEIAKHRHFNFSNTTATSVVPVAQAPATILASEADPRFLARSSAEVPAPHLGTVTLDASAFAPPTVTSLAKSATGTDVQPLDKGAASPVIRSSSDQDGGVGIDLAGARQALRLYRQGDLAAADDFARLTSGPLRTLLDWTAIRLASRQAGLPRLEAFKAAHPDWPTMTWINRRIEEAKVATRDPAATLALFASSAPETLFGRLALARARIATGDLDGGAGIIRSAWRNDDLTAGEEALILKDFGTLLRREDHKFRADRLLYKENLPAAMRATALAGPDVALLEKARIAVIGSMPSDAAIAAVPKALQSDPGLLFAKIQKARRANKIADAATMMLSAPSDPTLLVDGDEWWTERRLVARKLLDAGDAKTAFRICATHGASSNASRIEAEFHAGWIALRFLNDPVLAAPHFANAATLAESPISTSRAAYWQGRAAAAAGDAPAAARFYDTAAQQPTTFYGQIANAALGRPPAVLRQPIAVASGPDRREAIQGVGLLFDLGERDLALGLALTIAKTEPDPSQVAALASVVAATKDARATLSVGKAAGQRGIALDDAAFPTFGIPAYQPLTNSADRSTVYAIARQESEFDPRSVSSAGAKGLMQLIGSTARQTAVKAGIDFDETRLLLDAGFNAQIGAAHLGKLLADENGSYILTFAAYNAGARKVQDWIGIYGDPRKPGVDPIDWIERIPYSETRNYVQRVFENMQMYRARFGVPTASLSDPQPTVTGKGT
ncbi:lytic transglycosylase domain-containing protein [Lichenihabitans psoromatis]|uniref:lytic transglycosylase domain-containing protein n=1 Tax=Lichenihabitans psoromatis TaxID=2528642 RepID=UPI001035E3AA|nr:lytic transglycosylase domain-containing protein [Lichenihabitans psoromatis]